MKTWSKIEVEKNTRNDVSNILRYGVLIAALITLFGGILFFIQHPEAGFEYATFDREMNRLRDVSTIINETLLFKGRAIIQFGILVLITTPVLRVLFSMIGFVIEKDWMYVAITGVVIAVLFFSLFG